MFLEDLGCLNLTQSLAKAVSASGVWAVFTYDGGISVLISGGQQISGCSSLFLIPPPKYSLRQLLEICVATAGTHVFFYKGH